MSFDEISSRVKIGPSGTDLADLRIAATALGIPSTVIRTTDFRLDQVPLPAIVHFQVRDGHYRLLLKVTEKSVVTADMTSALIEEVDRDEFLENWSGFLLVPSSSSHWWTYALCSIGLAFAFYYSSRALISFGSRRH